MTDTKPTIEEQILQAQRNVKSAAFYESNLDVEKAILASLEELAAIKSQPVPVEPVELMKCGLCGLPYMVFRKEYDSLLSQLQMARQDKERLYKLNVDCEAVIIRQREERKKQEERAEKAEADNQRLRKDCDEHARWRADLADKLHDAEAELGAAQNSDEHNFNRWQKAEAELAALRLELGQITGEIPYGN